MRRDSIFYKIFQQFPTLVFELLSTPPTNPDGYRFDSVAVKEPQFEIDGVFVPPENEGPGTVYFCEVQFQKDELLYERLFAESSLYFYRNRARFSDWQAVVIYPSRSVEQSDIHPHRSQLNGQQVHRVFLNELGDIRQLPLGLALMVLTTLKENLAPQEARYLLERSRQEQPQAESHAIIVEMVTTIMVYKFGQITRSEVEAMLGITLQQTRVYQEIESEATAKLIIRQLTRRFGELSEEMRVQISSLPMPVLENLGDALLDFNNLADLQAWLQAQ